MSGLVALMTDFGTRDAYVGEVKAAILKENRRCTVIDISHEVEPFSILDGAFILYVSHRHFPEGTVFLVIVDPGVGTARRGIVLRSKRYWFVAPDNGVAYPAASSDGIRDAYVIATEAYPRPFGETFHGRDVFARVAACLAAGRRPKMRRVELGEVKGLSIGRPSLEGGRARLRVLHVDRFGNAVLSLEMGSWGLVSGFLERGRFRVAVGGRTYTARYVPAYGYAEVGELVALWGGTGFLELAVNRGSAAKRLGVSAGSEVVFVRPKRPAPRSGGPRTP